MNTHATTGCFMFITPFYEEQLTVSLSVTGTRTGPHSEAPEPSFCS